MNKKALYDQGNYQELVNQIGLSQNADDLQLKAFSYQKLGQFELAMESWNTLIQKLPEVGSFYNERGVCKFNLKFKHAMDDFDQAVALEPENPYFYACRAYIKDKLGNSEGAVEDYQKAHDLDPADEITLNNLGLAEQKLGYTSKAREYFKKSNDLIGYEEKGLDEELPQKEPSISPPSRAAKWKEVRKMLSSWKEFKAFWKEMK